MNPFLAVSLWIALATTPIGASTAPSSRDIDKAAIDLDAKSKSTLGVGIRALSFIFDANPGTFLNKQSLVDNGSWGSLQQLESAGLVRIRLVQSGQGDLVQMDLTPKGEQVVRAPVSGK